MTAELLVPVRAVRAEPAAVAAEIKMDTFVFQWHLLETCDKRCSHCYQSSYSSNGLELEQNKLIADKLRYFINRLEESSGNKIKAHINLTGGEPLLKQDIFELIRYLRPNFSIGILSNGSLINENIANIIKLSEISFVQLSLEGNREINDSIRGKGAFDETMRAIGFLKMLDIKVLISFTLNSHNYLYFNDLVKECAKRGADKIWFDRYIPSGIHDKLIISSNDFITFLNQVEILKDKYKGKIDISTSRALQFLECGGKPYRCKAGKSLLTILPCRRLPIIIGNIINGSLIDIYNDSQILKDLRNPYVENCSNCFYYKRCNGGLKCLSYALYGDFNRKDPNCGLLN